MDYNEEAKKADNQNLFQFVLLTRASFHFHILSYTEGIKKRHNICNCIILKCHEL